MTDSEKLDLILSKITEMDARQTSMDARLESMDARQTSMDARLESMDARQTSMDKRLNRLEVGQAEIKKELYMLNRQIADTYRLALDAWGKSTENRVWLETGSPEPATATA